MQPDGYAPIAAGLYDLAYGDFLDDVDLYANLGDATGGDVLELGAGTGRVAIELVRRGFEVVGVDSSPTMLARAAANLSAAGLEAGRAGEAGRTGGLELVEADMRRFDLGRRFGLVIIAADTFQHLLTTDDQAACLTGAVHHLDASGTLCFSVRSPSSVDWTDENGGPLLLEWARQDPRTGETVLKQVAGRSDPARQVKRWTYVYDRVAADGAVSRAVFQADLRYSSEAEIRLLLQHVGLHVTHVYGDYDLSPVGEGDNLIFVAMKEDALENRS